MQTPTAPFDRSLQQRMAALQSANKIRSSRKQIKRDLKASRIVVAGLIAAPPAELQTMKVFALLLATPKIGRVKANRILQQHRISPSKTLGGMSQRQRVELAVALTSQKSNTRPQGRANPSR